MTEHTVDEAADTDTFTDPEEPSDWVDVRMTDPEEGEWDVDVVVAEGRVEYVDLRVRPGLLTGFMECLVDDMSDGEARRTLRRLADRQGIDLDAAEDADDAAPAGDPA